MSFQESEKRFLVIHDVRNKRATVVGGSEEFREDFARLFCEHYAFPPPRFEKDDASEPGLEEAIP